MSYERYTGDVTVTEVGETTFKMSSGWSMLLQEGIDLHVGDRLMLEMIGLNKVVGIMNLDTGTWYYRRTDAEIDAERQEELDRISARRRELLEANRDDWQRRTDALPEWIKERIEHFQRMGGEYFDLEGWGYELCIAELAVLYAEGRNDDDPAIAEYAEREGTSGNQHDFARALAAAHLDGRRLAGSVSGLTPLSGDPDYSGITR